MTFKFAGVDFEIDFEKIYEKLNENEKKYFDSSGFMKKVSNAKDLVKRTKYIVGPPYDKEMENEYPLVYVMFFAEERKGKNDKIQICNFAFNANMLLDEIGPERRGEFISLIQSAEYNHALKNLIKGKQSPREDVFTDKCVNFFFDEPQFENVLKLSLYYGGSKYKAQQWVDGQNHEIIKEDKQEIDKDIFYAIMAKAVDLMYKEQTDIDKEIGTFSLKEIKDYFLNSTEETVSSYELLNVAYRNAIEKGFIPAPQYSYDAGNYIKIHTFDTHTYTKEFLIERNFASFMVGYKINDEIMLECEKNMIYKKISSKEFLKSLLEEMLCMAHKTKIITSVKPGIHNIPKTFNTMHLYLNGSKFDMETFCRNTMVELSNSKMVSINPYTFYENSIIIPDMNNCLFTFNSLYGKYMISERDSVGIVSSTSLVDENTFIKKLVYSLNKDLGCNIKEDSVNMRDMAKFKKNNCLDLASYLKTLKN